MYAVFRERSSASLADGQPSRPSPPPSAHVHAGDGRWPGRDSHLVAWRAASRQRLQLLRNATKTRRSSVNGMVASGSSSTLSGAVDWLANAIPDQLLLRTHHAYRFRPTYRDYQINAAISARALQGGRTVLLAPASGPPPGSASSKTGQQYRQGIISNHQPSRAVWGLRRGRAQVAAPSQ